MDKILSAVTAIVIGVVVVAAVVGLLFALPVMWLWNSCLVPAVPGIKEVGFMQAWGLLILCSILFKTTASSK